MITTTNQTSEQFLLWRNLNKINYQLRKHEEKLLRKTHLTKAQHNVLLTIAFLTECNKIPIKLTDLLPYQDISLVGMSLVVNRMKEKQLVKKIRDRSDQRSVSLMLTQKGEKVLQASANPTSEFLKKIFSVFSNVELKQAAFLMDKLLAKVESEIGFQTKEPKNSLTLEQQVNFLNKLSRS
jgi:DNA-binding MarR family transcriptional regulator